MLLSYVNLRRLGGLVAALAGLGLTIALARDVASQPRDSRPLIERVHALEAKIERLERQLGALEAAVGKAPAGEPSSSSVRAFPAETADPCDPPVLLDPNGLRFVKTGCEGSPGVSACDPPWVLDERGVRTLRQGCTNPGVANCADPYRLDGAGKRVLRAECLDFGY